jgi:chromosome segregation protein
LKGEFLSGATIKVGPLGKATGLISRKSRLRQLQETIANITSEIAAIENQIEKNKQNAEHLDKLCMELRTAGYEANIEKTQINSKLAAFEQDIKRLSEEQPLIKGEIELLEQQIAQSVQKEYDSKQKLQELEAVNSERITRIKELETKYTEQKLQQQTLGNQLTDLKVALGQLTEHQQAMQQNLESLQNQLQANQTAVEAAQAEIKTCNEQCRQGQMDILACESSVSQFYVEKEDKQQSSSLLREKVAELLEKQKQLEEQLRSKTSEKQQIEQKINEIKIELSQLEVKGQDLIERVKDELQLDLVESYKNFSDENIDWEKIREEITELRDKIERLGNVNVDAIAEQEGLEQRYEFLSRQVEDLNQSKIQLQELINRLNKISTEKFVQTFEQIRMNFQQIFRKLFGGGKADVLLEDSEDILEAGIEIVARPPGKETRSISLLSGGEKSMTAIALLFAVFKTKPSPFCFLDEVDAALDEANNERFNLLINEFKKDSQFVVITHSKRTMSMADQLYGITMQTRGVSKKISVSFDDFEVETPILEQETAVVA